MHSSRNTDSSARSGRAITPIDRRFFAELVHDGPLSRVDIADRVAISRPTASESAARLLQAGVIVECGARRAGRGRTAVTYDVNAKRGHTRALAMEHDWLGLRTTDLKGDVIWERAETLGSDINSDKLLARASALMAAEAENVTSPRLATSVSIADPVDAATGAVIDLPDAPFPAAHVDVLGRLALTSEPGVDADNDVNWATLAEHRLGTMRDTDHFLYVHAGTGIGAGLCIHGRIFRGARGLSGEMGYMRRNGEITLMRQLADLGLASTSDESLSMTAAARLFETSAINDAAREILETLAGAIGDTLTMFDPDALVLAGPMADFPVFFDGLRERVSTRTLKPVTITRGAFGAHSPLIGAGIGAQERAYSKLGLLNTAHNGASLCPGTKLCSKAVHDQD